MGQTWGYCRVSTEDQNPASQVDALLAAGVPEGRVVVERVSGAARAGPCSPSWSTGSARATR